ncbi:hypothetical protein [Pseudoalteromonas sp. HF66]|uniref:hypothetical protein n=1 Tax=Pseudoalteromonas sp. HF66 TaxID=2721559 RepID=UPI0014311B0C|nr:hypothetical protein [Pseudoalteromonas sp. HF66]NIZ05445.1 hypothetical protein [Pseudoalteromonas sp. HF66]
MLTLNIQLLLKDTHPLMLAAELDEVDLFNNMLSKGGNPRKTYFAETLKWTLIVGELRIISGVQMY